MFTFSFGTIICLQEERKQRCEESMRNRIGTSSEEEDMQIIFEILSMLLQKIKLVEQLLETSTFCTWQAYYY